MPLHPQCIAADARSPQLEGRPPAFIQDWAELGYDVRLQQRRGGPEQMLDEALMVGWCCWVAWLKHISGAVLNLTMITAGAHGKPLNATMQHDVLHHSSLIRPSLLVPVAATHNSQVFAHAQPAPSTSYLTSHLPAYLAPPNLELAPTKSNTLWCCCQATATGVYTLVYSWTIVFVWPVNA